MEMRRGVRSARVLLVSPRGPGPLFDLEKSGCPVGHLKVLEGTFLKGVCNLICIHRPVYTTVTTRPTMHGDGFSLTHTPTFTPASFKGREYSLYRWQGFENENLVRELQPAQEC